jgi:hypothetical protein
LLASITTKSWQKYHRRGIFTITQLSYLYKVKKRRKSPKKTCSRHHPELQALAIRMGKIYLQSLPAAARNLPLG